MSKLFPEYKKFDLSEINKEVNAFWKDQRIFEKSLESRKDRPTFVFNEGPPSANGKPGIHHVMARTIKDIFCRYKTQQGYLVHRKAGWDTPVSYTHLRAHETVRWISYAVFCL